MVTAGLLLFFRHHAVTDLIDFGEAQNEALTRALANNLWTRYGDYISSVGELDSAALEARRETQLIYNELMGLTLGLPILKIKIFNLNGWTIFSSNADEMGKSQLNNIGFKSARSGKAATELTHRGNMSVFDHVVVNRDVISSYVRKRDMSRVLKRSNTDFIDAPNTRKNQK